ncbi:T9SS type A sorting domain-containing protein [uncultured Psychroserpens sp.]|uniref:T9SS type A sorting domain-containing protein n=1 Tax=uncultured Psychroserpens sp. TaxID=255436 RepID=UPI0026019651|nr:T9SS type A sorting domain-containing protein [uncultured Psychroserpens sp.]
MKKKISVKLAVLALFIICIVAIKNNTIFNKEKSTDFHNEKKSGAEKSLDLWAFERTYPNQSISIEKYKNAFEEKRFQSFRRSSLIEGEWESLGPENIGGRTLSLAFHPTNQDIIYAGTASGGLWKTETQGIGQNAWNYVPTGFPVLGVSAVAIDQTNPNILFIGTGENYGSSLAEPGTLNRLTRGTYGIGVLKSIDGGSSWSNTLQFDNSDLKGVQDIEISNQNSLLIFAATTDGVYRSIDGGDNWSLVFNQPNCFDIEIDFTNDNIIYVTQGAFNSNLNPSLSGIFKSTNGGNSFTELIDSGLIPAWSGNAKLAIDPSNSNTLYASVQVGFFNTQPTTPGGIFKSTNGGVNWSYINNQNIAQFQGWYSHDIAINPLNSNEIIYTGINTWKSTNAGINFIQKSDWTTETFGEITVTQPEGGPTYVHADIHAVYYHPLVPNKIFYATDGGVFSSSDAGETFVTHNGGLQTTQFYPNMASSPTNPNFCIGGAQDNSTWVYKGSPSWFKVIGGDGMSASVNQDDDQIVYGSLQGIGGLAKSTDGGDNWISIAPTLIANDYSAFLAPYELAPTNYDMIYAGTRILYKSLNGGQSWSPTRTQPIDGTNVVSKIAISNINPDILYVAMSTVPLAGLPSIPPKILKSVDGGVTFTNISSGLPNRICKDIEIDPSNDDVLYATFSGFGTDHVYKSTNAGDSWISIQNGLPDLPTNTILVDPLNSDDIYVGNDLGVYYSENGGTSWEDFSDALPDATMVMDLNLSPSNRKIRIATHGHGIWQRDVVNDALSVESFSTKDNVINIYPNPMTSNGIIEIKVKQALSTVNIEVYNLLGQLVSSIYNGNLNQGVNTFNLDVKTLSSGTYLIKMSSNNIEKTKRLIVK